MTTRSTPAPTGTATTHPSRSDERRSKGWDYAILGILVVVLMVLVATGVVPIFDF